MKRWSSVTNIQVRAYGQGLKLLDYPQVSVMNCDPRVLEKMNITEENGKLRVPVATISPAYLMGSGYGEPTACFWRLRYHDRGLG